MAVSAKHLENAVVQQERLARLESNLDHIQSSVTDLKAETRALDAKLDVIKDAINKVNTSRALDKVWWMSMTAGLLAVVARAFKWI